LDSKRGRGGKRDGAGRKRKASQAAAGSGVVGSLYGNPQLLTPIKPAPNPLSYSPLLSPEDTIKILQLRAQQQLPYLSNLAGLTPNPHIPNSNSPTSEEDVQLDEIISTMSLLNQKFMRYVKKEREWKLQCLALRKEKEDLQQQLSNTLKQKDILEHQLILISQDSRVHVSDFGGLEGNGAFGKKKDGEHDPQDPHDPLNLSSDNNPNSNGNNGSNVISYENSQTNSLQDQDHSS